MVLINNPLNAQQSSSDLTNIVSNSHELKTILDHLANLVSFDTQNPPRAISPDSKIFNYLKANLSGFEFTLQDAGDGCLSLLATRGDPQLLFNFHIDTVPIAPGWTSDPFKLLCENDKATALGACDIKGASACMLSAVTKTDGDVALLFSSDEEHGSSQAVKQFLQGQHNFSQVIVAEPTNAKAVVAHRGIQSAVATFSGISGHASEARAHTDSAIHKAGKWISAALDWVAKQSDSVQSLSGLPFNIGKINGGIKANMIAAECELAFGFRPLPGQNSQQIIDQLNHLASSDCQIAAADLTITDGFYGPTLPAANQAFDSAIIQALELAEQCQLTTAPAVNFWTEASLFSAAGLTALVFGPGDIGQAHSANEWVAFEQLQQVEAAYLQIINRNSASENGVKKSTLAKGEYHE